MLKRLILTAWIAGILVFIGLIIYHGAATVSAAVAAVGWGLAGVAVFHLLPMAADTLAWRCLLKTATRPGFVRLLWMRWIGESINTLLPAAQIGGDLMRGRLATHYGVAKSEAAASIIVDLTVSVFTLFLFAAGGVVLAARQSEITLVLVTGLLVAALLILFMLALQRYGLFQLLARILAQLLRHRDWERLAGGAAVLDTAIADIYARYRQLGTSCGCALCAWMLGAGEIWLSLYYLGHPIGMLDAMMLESLIQAVRSAAFPVPGAWGVQEGGLVLLGMLVAVPAELALAASLIKRVREIGLGIPGLIAWQFAEGRRWHYSGN